MPHSWDGGPIDLHIHWMGNNADTTATPRWGLEYTFASPNFIFPVTQTIYAIGNEMGDPDVVPYKHYLTEWASLTPTTDQSGTSSIIIGRVFRNSSDAADTYNVAGNKCGLLYIDAHFQIDSLGSDTEFLKYFLGSLHFDNANNSGQIVTLGL